MVEYFGIPPYQSAQSGAVFDLGMTCLQNAGGEKGLGVVVVVVLVVIVIGLRSMNASWFESELDLLGLMSCSWGCDGSCFLILAP